MHSKTKHIVVLAFIVAFLTVSNAFAGLVLTDADGTTTHIQNGKLRSDTEEGGDMWVVIDTSKSTIMMVNPEEQTYVQGTIDEYCAGMRSMMDAMSQFMGGMMPKPEPKQKVQVVKAGPGGKIAGQDTTRYKVMVDGVLREELWLANDASLMKEFGDPQVMAKFSQCAAMEQSYETAPEYQGLMKAGWALKSVSHENGESVTDTEVERIEKSDIPAAKFAAPKGYARIPMSEMFGPMGQ